ncbi:hypothetical protein GN244_ATG16154 [Phytophthora infestans]|uniref:Uncharacterized protein n=1 Tax=Phytophthora infestans TaxID=4787 RepID=A0A833WMY3_PHYIN|nr:hypothetical protein GN244_ATG16154 [Phytophthora infestans]KAF4128165.1 hypothetical protein GN958_ATG22711 [Phytophthora infestans]KAF4133187.1 hypothetical protein GN958_ATG17605 [Phytophthora infestans]
MSDVVDGEEHSTSETTPESTVEATQTTVEAGDSVDEVSLQEPEGDNDAEYEPNVMNEEAEQEPVSTIVAPVQMGT